MLNMTKKYDLEGELKKIIWFLPNQGPIKDFIHQNILLAYLDMPFEEALLEGSKRYKARAYMELSYYRQAFKDSKITVIKLEEALDYFLPKDLRHEREFIYYALFNYAEIKNLQMLVYLTKKLGISAERSSQVLAHIHAHERAPGSAEPTIADLIIDRVGLGFDHEIHQALFRFLGSYLDQGVSLWSHLDQWPSFQSALCHEAKQSFLPIASYVNNHDLSMLLKKPSEEIICALLEKFVSSPELYSCYLDETLFKHPGWSGMLKIIAQRPDTLSKTCNINLMQMLAVKLALQWEFIKNNYNYFEPISPADLEQAKINARKNYSANSLSLSYLFLNMPELGTAPESRLINLLDQIFLQKIWHRAMEQTHYQNIFGLFGRQKLIKPKVSPEFQVVFCVDDRECSFRRLLEKEDPALETFATAGFFGIDCYFQPHNNEVQKICPANLSPKHIITERNTNAKNADRASLLELALFMSRHGANNTLLGFLSAYTIGHFSLFSLLTSMFHPIKFFKSQSLALESSDSKLLFELEAGQKRDDGLIMGYTHEEMADRIFATINSMGMKTFSPLVFFIGHGSSSVNNPHFAAYDCQACSGHPGAVNARIFAAMANLKPVRELLRQKNLTIPEHTKFIGALHDTCTDQFSFFDIENLDSLQHELLLKFKKYINNVREKNAQERCRRFALVKDSISPQKALKEVEHRAHALFEPRPEMGHARNALAVVGRRERTYDINFDRRCFLQSYDPHEDPDGQILQSILSAVVPVCGHINLDYYFSRLDPAIYGCGTKLSHNVCSLIGVGNGLDDDLRTGLPIQMTELHEPLRLIIIIEQQTEIILSTLLRNPQIFVWIKNEWVYLAALDPNKERLSIFTPSTNSFKEV